MEKEVEPSRDTERDRDVAAGCARVAVARWVKTSLKKATEALSSFSSFHHMPFHSFTVKFLYVYVLYRILYMYI